VAIPDIVGSLRLPAGAPGEPLRAVVRLEDTTLLDAESAVVAETRCLIGPQTSSPVAFSLTVPDGVIKPGRSYALSARAVPATGGGRLLGTVQSYPWRSGEPGVTELEMRELD
jgi:hypothetical protein